MRKILLSSTSVAALAAGVLFGPTAANANAIVQNLVVHGTGTSVTSPLDLSLFDSNTGSLNSVLIFTSVEANSSGQYAGAVGWASNTTATGTFAHATATANTSVRITGGPSALNGSPLISVSANAGSLSIPGVGATTPFTVDATNSANISAGSLGSWEAAGGGTDALSVIATTKPNLGLPTFSFTWPNNQGPYITYTLQVTYNYTPSAQTPAPEPASILTLGSGLLGLGGLRWRRKRTRPRSPPKA